MTTFKRLLIIGLVCVGSTWVMDGQVTPPTPGGGGSVAPIVPQATAIVPGVPVCTALGPAGVPTWSYRVVGYDSIGNTVQSTACTVTGTFVGINNRVVMPSTAKILKYDLYRSVVGAGGTIGFSQDSLSLAPGATYFDTTGIGSGIAPSVVQDGSIGAYIDGGFSITKNLRIGAPDTGKVGPGYGCYFGTGGTGDPPFSYFPYLPPCFLSGEWYTLPGIVGGNAVGHDITANSPSTLDAKAGYITPLNVTLYSPVGTTGGSHSGSGTQLNSITATLTNAGAADYYLGAAVYGIMSDLGTLPGPTQIDAGGSFLSYCIAGNGCKQLFGTYNYATALTDVSNYVAGVYGQALNQTGVPLTGKIAAGWFELLQNDGAARSAGIATENNFCGATSGNCAGVYVGALDCGTTVGDCVSYYAENPLIPSLYAEGWTVHEGHTLAIIAARGAAWENGSQDYCTDCKVTSGADNTCVGSGSGAVVFRINGVNKCLQ